MAAALRAGRSMVSKSRAPTRLRTDTTVNCATASCTGATRRDSLPDHQHVGRPEQGAQQDQAVARVDAHDPPRAEQIQARPRRSAAPAQTKSAGLLADQQSQQGHENHVEPGDEAGLARGGVDHPVLLQGGAQKQDAPRRSGRL